MAQRRRLLFGLIVTIWAGSSMWALAEGERWPAEQEVFHCTFDQSQWDKNFDHWPDQWIRHYGPGYPIYLPIKRIDDPTAAGGSALQIQLDGGAAAVFSPPIPALPVYAYVLEVFLKTQTLQHDQAYVSLNFLDAKLQTVGRKESEKVSGSTPWQKLRLGPVRVESPETRYIRIGLHVEPTDQADLEGEVAFADVWLGQLPWLRMWVKPRTHLFYQNEQVEIFAEACGFTHPNCQIEWELYDVWGRVLSRHREALEAEVVLPAAYSLGRDLTKAPMGQGGGEDGRARPEPFSLAKAAKGPMEPIAPPSLQADWSVFAPLDGKTSPEHLVAKGPQINSSKGTPTVLDHPAEVAEAQGNGASRSGRVYRSRTHWLPPIEGPGFYRVSCRLVGISSRTPPCQLDFGVLGPGFSEARGEFGWSLPLGDRPLGLEELAPLVIQMGLGWIKYPVWFDLKADEGKVEAWVVFSERLNGQGIEIVGMLARPPAEVAKQFAAQTPLAADIFAMDPARWWPVVEPVLLRLAPRIHWWQLGLDNDQSFVGLPHLEQRIRRVKEQWEKVGKDLQLGFGWDWVYEVPRVQQAPPPWRFLCFRAEPPLTADELAVALSMTQKGQVLRWVCVEPLPKEEYPLQERAADLVHQMVAAKIGGADAIFLPDPFHPQRGLMHPDGTIGELLLVWRSLAQGLSGARYLGTLPMPNRSPNYLFLRQNEAFLILWNDTPTEEVLYLGKGAEELDLWGRAQPLARRGHQHVLQVSRLPSLVRGLDPTVAQWRIHCQLATVRIPSLFGRPHANRLKMHNPLGRGVSGQAKLIVPEGWMVHPETIPFRLGPGENLEVPFFVTVPYTAANGKYPLIVEIRLHADQLYQFQVHRWIDVGLGDVYIQIATRLNDRQELEVEQRLVNETEQSVAFECQLFAPGRKRLRTQVVLDGRGQEVFTYRLSDGKELIGKTLCLQAVELGGQRVLTYRFTVAPPAGNTTSIESSSDR